MKWHKKIIALIVFQCLILCGCSITETVNNELQKDYFPDDSLLVIDTEAEKIREEEKELLSGMEKTLENDYLELYIGSSYDIAVYNKITGKVTWSNPALHELTSEEQNKLTDETKKTLFSQLTVEYYNTQQKKATMSSYPDSFSEDKNQVTYEVMEDALIVTYGIGTSYADTSLIPVFTKETFEQYDAVLKEKADNKEISIIEYRAFVNNYTAYRYSEMSVEDQKEYLEKYPSIEELDTIYVIKTKLTNKITNQLLEMYTMLGIDDAVKAAENEKLGEVQGNSTPAYFKIPIRYRLHGNDLIVSVDLQSIEPAEGYYLTKVELLKTFGATGKEEEGYLFLPDGSGMIIENNSANNSMDKVELPFYGQDYAKNFMTASNIAIDNTFPVFGVKGNEKAVFAIVEQGAAIGGVGAQTISNYMCYNIAYPYFTYHAIDNFGLEGVSYAFYPQIPDLDYTVRYHFLYGENATYSGMAKYYQQYLEQSGSITRMTEDTKELPLDIELIGSIEKTVHHLGIPFDSAYAVTTFDQAETILSELKDHGIGNVDVLYSGMVNGGMQFKAASKIKIQKELGELKGFQKLNENLNQAGYQLYTNIDITRIYEKGNGIKKKEDVSRYLNKSTVIMGSMNPATGYMDEENASCLVNPLRYQEVVDSFLKEFQKTKSTRIYMSSVGTYLNANYSSREGMTRYTAQLLTEDALKKLYDHSYKMKFDGGNDYVLAYADSLANIATVSSHQRIESYSIPFVGMVLKGYLPYTGRSINQAGNSTKAVLESIESGAGFNFLLMYDNQLNLSETEYKDLFSINYKLWMEDIIATYRKVNDEIGYLSGVRIDSHEHLAEDVNCITYEDGSRIYVNYGNDGYDTPDGRVEAMSYLVIQ